MNDYNKQLNKSLSEEDKNFWSQFIFESIDWKQQSNKLRLPNQIEPINN